MLLLKSWTLLLAPSTPGYPTSTFLPQNYTLNGQSLPSPSISSKFTQRGQPSDPAGTSSYSSGVSHLWLHYDRSYHHQVSLLHHLVCILLGRVSSFIYFIIVKYTFIGSVTRRNLVKKLLDHFLNLYIE